MGTVTSQPASVLDHEAAPEWETAFFSDFCLTCGWPVSKVGEVWVHDEKNPVWWTDRRKTATESATADTPT